MADVGEWVVWLRLPGPARQGRVGVLPTVEPAVSERTQQRKLAAVSAFYGFHRRLDPEITLQLTRWDRGFSSSGYQPFLAHTRRQQGRQEVRVRGVLRSAPEVLEAEDYQALLDACTRLRNRFLVQLLRETGMRIGEALGLRHKDLSIARREVAVARRVLSLLGDRRMLWKDFSLEIEEHCVTSAHRAREQLSVHLDNPEIGTELARRLHCCSGSSATSSTKSARPVTSGPPLEHGGHRPAVDGSRPPPRSGRSPGGRTGRRLRPRRVRRTGGHRARPGGLVLRALRPGRYVTTEHQRRRWHHDGMRVRPAKRPKLLILLLAVLAVALATSCATGTQPPQPPIPSSPTSSPAPPIPAPTDSAPPARTLIVRVGECPDATGYDQATSGPISIGNFTPEAVGPPQPGQDGYKTWVISQRPGHDDAVVKIRDPDAHTTTERRPTGVSWASGVEQFFPGTLRLHSNGTYRITASVGPDSICVKVRYQVTCPTTVTAHEIRGTTTPDATLWALLFAEYPLAAETEIKIVWRMTGEGDVAVAARAPDGHTIQPTWGPEAHSGSNWNKPGAEWGTGFNFSTPGCWTLTATRGTTTGTVNAAVR